MVSRRHKTGSTYACALVFTMPLATCIHFSALTSTLPGSLKTHIPPFASWTTRFQQIERQHVTRLDMHVSGVFCSLLLTISLAASSQIPLSHNALTPPSNRSVSNDLFAELERLSRLTDIAYCVAPPALGISKPFSCLSHCADFPDFELITTWHTGPLLSDSAGYLAIDHGGQGQIMLAFRGTYSVADAVVDLSTVPQKFTPYPGDGEDVRDIHVPSKVHKETTGELKVEDECSNCTVHMGFNAAWGHSRQYLLPHLYNISTLFPAYRLVIVGHSLGGAVAMLAALELNARGLAPTVTTYGEPRVGNKALMQYLDRQFHLNKNEQSLDQDIAMRYRRVTHIDDPIPLLPLTEWGYTMHAGEIFISKSSLSPNVSDLRHCFDDLDPTCIASQDGSLPDDGPQVKRDVINSVRHEIDDLRKEPWGIPSRYKLWQLFFAHRDYFHRIGLCVPGGDPTSNGMGFAFKAGSAV